MTEVHTAEAELEAVFISDGCARVQRIVSVGETGLVNILQVHSSAGRSFGTEAKKVVVHAQFLLNMLELAQSALGTEPCTVENALLGFPSFLHGVTKLAVWVGTVAFLLQNATFRGLFLVPLVEVLAVTAFPTLVFQVVTAHQVSYSRHVLHVTPLAFRASPLKELLADMRAGLIGCRLRTGFRTLAVQFHSYIYSRQYSPTLDLKLLREKTPQQLCQY